MKRINIRSDGRIFFTKKHNGYPAHISDKIIHMIKLRDPFLIVVLLLSLVLGTSILTRGHEWGDDFASYIMQAQSILNGNMDEFIERNTFTIFESSVLIGPVAYPWGYPLVLTPVLLLKGVHALALKLPGLFFFAGFLVCLYLLIEARLTRTESLLLVSLLAFNPTLLRYLDYIISDMPFLFFVFLVLLWITRLNAKQGIWTLVFLGTTIFLAFFIRTNGIILLASFLADQALRFYQEQTKRKDRILNSTVVVAVFGVLWLSSSLIFPNGQGAYFRQLMGFTWEKFITRNIPGYFYFGAEFLGIQRDSAWVYVYYLLVALFIVGAWKRRNADQHILLFFIIYLGAMIVWPEWQGIRFAFPVLPIFIYFAFQGMNAFVRMLPERQHLLGKGAVSLLWLILAGIFLFNSGTQAYANLKDGRKINGPFDPFSSDMFNYIKAETPPESVVVFFKPRAMRLFTNRDSIMALECDHLTRGDYIVLHKTWEYSQILPDKIQDCNLPLTSMFENRRFIIYEILK